MARYRVLVIEDGKVDARLLEHLLAKQDYEATTVNDGASGLDASKGLAPDLILLDIRLPDMDGYEVCRQLKGDPATKDIPLIFISSLADEAFKVKAFAVGGVDYIAKPFHPEEVAARVRTHLALRELQVKLQATNQELSFHVEELQRRNEELDAFAHTVAHDLKNPLQVILGMGELLTDDCAPYANPAIMGMLVTMSRAGQKMKNIIDELLLLSSLHQQDIETTELDMAGVVQGALDTLVAVVRDYGAQLSVPDEWPVVMGYGPWVEQVWANYVSNAIKYGGRPPIVELGSAIELDGAIRFWVRDNGLGISAGDQARLFLPRERLGAKHVEGEGLGLSIVQRIVHRLGGQVGVQSSLGEGSTFSFTLPAAVEDRFSV